MIQMGLDNDATSQIADQALGGSNKWTTYPGHTFAPDTKEFNAVLATPNARGAARLLLQRREAFG